MPSSDDTREKILAAVIEAASVHGISRLSVADVAHRAGLSRPTVYKHFPSKETLIGAAVLSEASRVVEGVVAAAATEDSPRAGLETSVLAALRLAREHPLLDRIIRTEPEALLPFLTSDGGAVMLFVRRATEEMLTLKLPALGDVARRRLADIVARLLVSYAVSAPDDPPEVVAAAVASILVDGAHATVDTVTIGPH